MISRMTIAAIAGFFVLTCAIAITANPAAADCFDFKADSHATVETIRRVTQVGTETVNGAIDKNKKVVRHKVWVGNGDYLAVQMAARYPPFMAVTRPDETAVLSESWFTHKQDGYSYAELNFDGRLAHVGNDGWVDVVFRAADLGDEGQFQAWIYSIEKVRAVGEAYCDAKFVSYQGGDKCDTCDGSTPVPKITDCGGLICQPDECCQLTFGVVGNCLKQPVGPDGYCRP